MTLALSLLHIIRSSPELKKLINSLEEQNCDYFVIDNSPNKIDDLTTERYKWLGGNKGIAQAQNEGIQWALEAKYPYIIFLTRIVISKKNSCLRYFQQ